MKAYEEIKEKLEQLKCPVHNQGTTINFKGDVFFIGETCCDEFRNTISKELQYEYNQIPFKFLKI